MREGLGRPGVTGRVKGGSLWPWAHPVDLSSPLSRPLWSRVKCFSYSGLQRGQLLTPLPTKQLLNTTCQTMLSWSSWFKSKRWTRKQANRRMLSDGKRAGGFPFCPHGAEGRTQMKERPLFSWVREESVVIKSSGCIT